MCDTILTDLGMEFTSESFKLVLKYFGIKHLHTTVTHPQTNAMVERYHRCLKKMLCFFVNEYKDSWD